MINDRHARIGCGMNGLQTSRLKTKVADEVRFLKNWIDKPLTTGAVSPSGKALTRLMASFVSPVDTLPVLELGPGTGVVTQALLARGVAPGRIVSVEYNPQFCSLLAARFPGVSIVEGDAYDLDLAFAATEGCRLSAVVSSLPLFTQPLPKRRALLEGLLARMRPGAPFIQFSYALVPPVPAVSGAYTVDVTPWVLKNVPPARVWVYRGVGGA
ncbi:class I SAM-dependent methyltransferase [Prosthecomicrobium pneumaticum]|uniref:Phosphatidylethanolamine/phosphatidyl-N-methylethanolamine N-methyltransferase n=1 Tax=Prosthecomicrobium pneumaticum TaxID=81895 RepID=A0A7W9FNW0_9HYPH|nr:phosphatidylethanolamine/phosphatidyl-N-methylethanolamine N-methyltransferase [Prosthecomicrobium pneumaticum]